MSAATDPAGSERLSPLAGRPAPVSVLVDVDRLLAAYTRERPDPAVSAERVAFGTSGHRGTSLERSFNEWHVLAISQAICEYRTAQHIDGPLFLGIDTHALSRPAFESALEVLAANGVETVVAARDEYTPTPAVSHAILCWNRGRTTRLADGIVVTPSHNPPDSGGFKYNPPTGGPADSTITGWVEKRANALLATKLDGLKRMPFVAARRAATTREHDFLAAYVDDLGNVLDFDSIRGAGVRMGVDPLGGAGVHYWARIAERYRLDLKVVSEQIDPTFRFMSVDWDGRIRMDPSSAYAMQRLIGLKDRFDVAFGCDTDHDRHGIVTPGAGLLPANHYLSVAIDYLFRHRAGWRAGAAVGKTVVSSSMIDRVAAALGRSLYEVPVGFKWFVDGLHSGALGFTGEESAGASFLRRDGSAWSTDKDGITAALLAGEICARSGRDPGEYYRDLVRQHGEPLSQRIDAPADADKRARLGKLTGGEIRSTELAGERIATVLERAPGNGAPIGGIKVIAPSGWFAARPSGTEAIYKLYAESFRGAEHLGTIISDAQRIVDEALRPR
jgi:phosphoglucomutase